MKFEETEAEEETDGNFIGFEVRDRSRDYRRKCDFKRRLLYVVGRFR